MTYEDTEPMQREMCLKQGCDFDPTESNVKVGFAARTKGRLPINGLRLLPEGDTSGWYIWCGTEFSSDPDFFVPLCARHLIERCPESIRFLGLPPGHRFLTDGSYVDVWFDELLLEEQASDASARRQR